jgi:isoamylase
VERRYRDVIRAFVRGDAGHLVARWRPASPAAATSTRAGLRHPINSINFVTCHDGFTLADLVSYNHKHNAANGEGNRDGCGDNLSWNCGVEGETDDPDPRPAPPPGQEPSWPAAAEPGHPDAARRRRVPAHRGRQQQHLVPGQRLGWLDWSLVERNADNMGPEAVPFELPRLPGPRWHRAVDTALASPDDVVAREEQAPVEGRHYVVGPGAVVVLEAR